MTSALSQPSAKPDRTATGLIIDAEAALREACMLGRCARQAMPEIDPRVTDPVVATLAVALRRIADATDMLDRARGLLEAGGER